ncbi:phage shock protein PspC (stress-responsive transcriptional regulator) [Alkalibacillus salilacus]|uniref:Phage shock protein PspC (Stress-responsive transcriptional regulator) n=1 Tax=Alkalibacillus salilacus TaxID=284582 RepID=A0ABT9VII3_9BACI|nr:phage shock protein PspC (stress-responsive transcriptional regulator) [Alkalibacillus salilacus]
MSKNKFWLFMILGILTGVFLTGVLEWFNFNISLVNIFQIVLGEPNFVSVIIILVVTLLFSYFVMSSLYKKFVKP